MLMLKGNWTTGNKMFLSPALVVLIYINDLIYIVSYYLFCIYLHFPWVSVKYLRCNCILCKSLSSAKTPIEDTGYFSFVFLDCFVPWVNCRRCMERVRGIHSHHIIHRYRNISVTQVTRLCTDQFTLNWLPRFCYFKLKDSYDLTN